MSRRRSGNVQQGCDPPGAGDAQRGRGRRRLGSPERGSGTVFALAMMMLLGLGGSAAVLVGQATTVRHRAEGAADLAALAAAQVAQTGGDACAAAATIAAANGGRLVSCGLGAPDGGAPNGGAGVSAPDAVMVRVSVTAKGFGGRALTATARARAGAAAP